MDGARLSRFPHLSWLRFQLTGSATGAPLVLDMEGVCHTVCCTFRGRQGIRQITRGRETSWHEEAGTVNVLPADGELHTFVTAPSPDLDTAVFLLPRRHLRDWLTGEGYPPSQAPGRMLIHGDPVLRSCMARLASGADVDDDGACRTDEAALRLLLRLMALGRAGPPDWHDDASTFDSRTLGRLVDYIDEHLRTAPTLAEMGMRVGLSPSHFARKFGLSTGLSLHRFVNRRRLNRSLELLKAATEPLPGIALDLGFSSQSHFTRLFSRLTGMTPAKYRRQFRRTVG